MVDQPTFCDAPLRAPATGCADSAAADCCQFSLLPELLERDGPAGMLARWWVLHTRARNEKAVASALDRQGVATYYLPLARVTRTYGGRKFPVRIPLFPGYLFLFGGADERLAAIKTNRVANVIHVADQAQFRREIRQVFRVVESEQQVDLYPALRDGRRCRITAGSLKGIEGVVLRRRDKSRVFISATVLGQSAVIEIDSALLEAVD